MRIKIKYITPIDRIVNKNLEYVEIENNGTVKSIINYLEQIYGSKFSNLIYADYEAKRYKVMFILNNMPITKLEENVNEGDELVILPRIGGG